MADKIILFLTTMAVFLVIDLIWLGFIGKKFYRKYLGFLMREKPNWTAAIIFYVVYILGMLVFVISPALEKASWSYALLYGGFFGLVAYVTYDLTNMATLKDWPLKSTIVDIIWGTLLTSSVCTISYFINSF